MKTFTLKRFSGMKSIVNSCRYSALMSLGIILIGCVGPYQKEPLTSDQEKEYTHYSGWGFSVHIPHTMIVKEQPCIDFLLYQFIESTASEEKEILSAYAGDYPDFGEMEAKHSKKKSSFRIHGLKAKNIQWEEGDGQFSREVLITMPYKFQLYRPSRFKYVHFWYIGLSDEERKVADAIIMSIKTLEIDTK